MSTYDWLELETLGFWLSMPTKIILHTISMRGAPRLSLSCIGINIDQLMRVLFWFEDALANCYQDNCDIHRLLFYNLITWWNLQPLMHLQ